MDGLHHMMAKWLLAAALMGALPATLHARQPTPSPPSVQRGQPDPSKLEGICTAIYRQRVDTSSPGNYKYAYERKIYEAAGVDFENDTQASARAKIQKMWIDQRQRLRCDGTNFPIANGSVLKYAIETRTYTFLDNATRFWRVDLNLVDDADGATVLDYLSDRILENRGSALEPTLRNYYDRLRHYGARHCRELPDTSACAPWEMERTDPLNRAPARPGRNAIE